MRGSNGQTPRDRARCVFCGQVVDRVAWEEQKAKGADVREVFFEAAEADPEMMERFARFREFMETFEENPELLDEVERFADELAGD